MCCAAAIYARALRKDQAHEGLSIPTQFDLLRSHAPSRHLKVPAEIANVENAWQTARAVFGQRLTFTKNYSGTLSVLVEKTDRLHRNPGDWAAIDKPDLEIHPVKEGHRAVNDVPIALEVHARRQGISEGIPRPFQPFGDGA